MAGALARKYLYEPWPREFSMYSTVGGNKFATISLSFSLLSLHEILSSL